MESGFLFALILGFGYLDSQIQNLVGIELGVW